MPHIDIKYKPDKIKREDLERLRYFLIEAVSDYFSEPAEYISADVLPQTDLAIGRKDLDVEVNCSPDEEGMRAKRAGHLAIELAAGSSNHLRSLGYAGIAVSAWVRIYADGAYRTQEVRS